MHLKVISMPNRNFPPRGPSWCPLLLFDILYLDFTHYYLGPPRQFSGKESTCQCRKCRFNPWVEKSPWRRKWQPTPVSLPGESHGLRRLVGYSPRDHKRIGHNLATKQQQQHPLLFMLITIVFNMQEICQCYTIFITVGKLTGE